MLKNDDQILPINLSKIKIVVLGKQAYTNVVYNGGGEANVEASSVSVPLISIKKEMGIDSQINCVNFEQEDNIEQLDFGSNVFTNIKTVEECLILCKKNFWCNVYSWDKVKLTCSLKVKNYEKVKNN